MAKDFTKTFLSNQSPEEVFKTVLNVRGWWYGLYDEEILGETKKLNDVFTFRAGGGEHYSKLKLIELVPGKKVVWLVTEAELAFVDTKDEWVGTKMIFDISKKGNKTEVRFTHEGLHTQVECYDACSSAWQRYFDEKMMPLINA